MQCGSILRIIQNQVRQAENIFGFPAVIQLNQNYSHLMKDHLLSLPIEDRRLRFYSAQSDVAVERYIENLNFDRDEFFGIFSKDLTKLVAFLHLAITKKDKSMIQAEIGISVDPTYRKKGYAKKLMSRVMNYCISRGIDVIVMECLKENKTMQNLAKSLDMKVTTEENQYVATTSLEDSSLIEKYAADSIEKVYKQISLIDEALFYNLRRKD